MYLSYKYSRSSWMIVEQESEDKCKYKWRTLQHVSTSDFQFLLISMLTFADQIVSIHSFINLLLTVA